MLSRLAAAACRAPRLPCAMPALVRAPRPRPVQALQAVNRFNNTHARGIHVMRSRAPAALCVHSGSLVPQLMAAASGANSVRYVHNGAPHDQHGQKWVHPDNVPKGEYLKQFGQDLTTLAEKRELDPVIGRHDEIRRTIQILCRRTKNNPVLIGEPGVGKSAIAEGLAQRIINGEVPESMKGKRLVMLDLAALVAGASAQGQFEERLKGVLRDVENSNGQILLFIDELHTLMSAGRGGMDAANMLKPALARGRLHCVGATTLKEYKQWIEKDAALARRFQEVYVAEPNVEDTITILRGLRERYEVHHGVQIQDAALVAAAQLSAKYMTGRLMPDKAVDLVDEAASRLRLQQDSKPERIWKLEKVIATKKIEIEALRLEKDKKSASRLKTLEKEVAKLDSEMKELTAKWNQEKAVLERVTERQLELEKARARLDEAQRMGEWSKAGELMHSTIPKLEHELEAAEKANDATSMLGNAVTPDIIAEVVAASTGIPVDRLLMGEREKLLHMEDELAKSVVGQDEAVTTVSDTLRLARAGLHKHDRPMGVLLFLGPTGVGKTQLAKALSKFMFNDENAMTRIDMSEYMEKHAVSRLIGAPPGYIGYEEGGTLSEAVRRRPYQLVLFDETEKAHRDVTNVLLQVFDDGRLTDSQGYVVDFKNTIIILTSNLGGELLSQLAEGSTITPAIKASVMEHVRAHFPPEFINRLDDVVMFNQLSRDAMTDIVEVQLEDVRGLLKDKGCELVVTPQAQQWLSAEGYNPAYGARPLKRTIQRVVLNPMSKLFLAGDLREGETVTVGVEPAPTFGAETPAPADPDVITPRNMAQYRIVVSAGSGDGQPARVAAGGAAHSVSDDHAAHATTSVADSGSDSDSSDNLEPQPSR